MPTRFSTLISLRYGFWIAQVDEKMHHAAIYKILSADGLEQIAVNGKKAQQSPCEFSINTIKMISICWCREKLFLKTGLVVTFTL